MDKTDKTKRARGTRWCKTGTWFALIAVVLLVVGLGGAQIEALSPVAAFMSFGIGLLAAIISALAAAIGIAISMGTAGDASASRSWTALALSLIIIGTALSQRPDTSGTAPIHDLTTDTENPPQFDAILPLRADADNPPEYSGPDTADIQSDFYPDLVALRIDQPVDTVFATAEQTVRDLGWELVAADRAAGRIEATDTTQWFHFKDDVVIRLTPSDSGTIIDVRSKSRVGRGDMGANARRIRAFLDRLTTGVAG